MTTTQPTEGQVQAILENTILISDEMYNLVDLFSWLIVAVFVLIGIIIVQLFFIAKGDK